MCEINKSGHNYRVIARRLAAGVPIPHWSPRDPIVWPRRRPATPFCSPRGRSEWMELSPHRKCSLRRQRIDIYDVMDFIVACCKIFICTLCRPRVLAGPNPALRPHSTPPHTETVKWPSAVQDVNFAAKRDNAQGYERAARVASVGIVGGFWGHFSGWLLTSAIRRKTEEEQEIAIVRQDVRSQIWAGRGPLATPSRSEANKMLPILFRCCCCSIFSSDFSPFFLFWPSFVCREVCVSVCVYAYCQVWWGPASVKRPAATATSEVAHMPLGPGPMMRARWCCCTWVMRIDWKSSITEKESHEMQQQTRALQLFAGHVGYAPSHPTRKGACPHEVCGAWCNTPL